jgi:purine-binding chemotaxis protein CheW
MSGERPPSEPLEAAKVLALATEESFLLGRATKAALAGHEILTLRVGRELYGVEVPKVREILRMREITEVPRAPAFLLGIVSVRGVIIPVLDLRKRLGMPASPETRETRIVVVGQDGEPFGLLVDEVRAVVRILEDQIEPAQGLIGLAESGFVSGISRVPDESGPARDRVVILLSLAQVVAFTVSR